VFYTYIKVLENRVKNLNIDIFNLLNEHIPRRVSHTDLDCFAMKLPKKVDYFPIGSKKSAYSMPPPNNDGRDYCWWCGEKTNIIQGITSQYNVCGKCGK
jgi:hypothetical protein